MKKNLIIVSFLFFSYIGLSFAQNKQAKLIYIRHSKFVNYFFTGIPADCDGYSLWGGGDLFIIEEEELINSFMEKLHNGIKDTILFDNGQMNNVRAKLVIYHDTLPNDIICINNHTYYSINGIIIKDEEFVGYIKELVKSSK